MDNNLLKIIKDNKIDFVPVSGTDERIFICPVCGKENHFYFNIKKGLGICHRCHFECNALTFLMFMLGLDFNAASELLRGTRSVSFKGLRKRVRGLLSEVSLNGEDVEQYDVFFKNPLPKNLVKISEDNFLEIFNERNVSLDLAKKSGVSICKSEGIYKDRLIFPIRTLKNETFTAVSSYGKEKVRELQRAAKERGFKYKKSLFPKGSIMSEIIYNFNYIINKKKFVIVEGIWDFFALSRLNIPACALLGSSISKRQANFFSRTKAEVIFLMLDGSLDKKILHKNFFLLKEVCYDKEIRLCLLPGQKDPDESSEQEIKKTLLESRMFFL